jgi:hypothetical protein
VEQKITLLRKVEQNIPLLRKVEQKITLLHLLTFQTPVLSQIIQYFQKT